MIVAQEPAESLAAADGPVCARWREEFWRNQPIEAVAVHGEPTSLSIGQP